MTPAATASRQVFRMTEGSPAWKPQATLALDTERNIAVASPRLQRPYDSPTSLFRSMVVSPLLAMCDPRLIAWPPSRMHHSVGLFNNPTIPTWNNRVDSAL